MESGVFMKNRKGQVSIEFLLLLIIMLLYIQLIIMPTIDFSANYAEDAIRLGEARFSAEKLANTIDYIALSSGESKQTIKLFVPKDANISCNANAAGNSIEFKVKISEPTADCPAPAGETYGECEMEIPLMDGINLICVLDLKAAEKNILAVIEIWREGDTVNVQQIS